MRERERERERRGNGREKDANEEVFAIEMQIHAKCMYTFILAGVHALTHVHVFRHRQGL